MLRQLRSAEKMKRILWIGLCVLIIPSMVAFYGFGSGQMDGGQRGTGEIASISYPDGKKGIITPEELRFAKNHLSGQLASYAQDQEIMLDNLGMSELTDSRAVLDQAVNLDILRHYAESNDITVSTEEVVQELQQVTTAEQRRQLQEQWRAQGQTVESVLETQRKGRVLQRAAESIGEQVRVTNFEAWNEYNQQKATIVADFVKVNPTDFLSSVTLTDEGTQKYFEENKEKFRVPDQVVYQYVLVRKDDLKSSLTVTEDEVTSYYMAHKEEFRLPRKVQASQIFLKMPTPDELNTTSPAAITSATLAVTKKADDLFQRAAKGEDFAQLAEQFTQEANFPPRADEGTTAGDAHTTAGGNLGLLSEEVAGTWYGDEWTSAVFAAKPGDITRPIRTAQGLAVVQVKEIIEGEVQALDDVRPVIETRVRDIKVEPVFEELGTRMQEVAESASGNLERMATATSSTVKKTSKVNVGERFVGGIGLLGEFQDAVADLEKGEVSDVLSDTQRHLIIQIAEEIPAHIPELNEVKARVEQAYKMQLSEEKAKERAEEILTKSTDFASFEQAVKDAGTTFTKSRPFTRMEASGVFGGPVTNFVKETQNLKQDTVHLTTLGRPGQQSSFVVWHVAQITTPSKEEFAKELPALTQQLTAKKREIQVLEYIRDQRQKLNGRIDVDKNYM